MAATLTPEAAGILARELVTGHRAAERLTSENYDAEKTAARLAIRDRGRFISQKFATYFASEFYIAVLVADESRGEGGQCRECRGNGWPVNTFTCPGGICTD